MKASLRRVRHELQARSRTFDTLVRRAAPRIKPWREAAAARIAPPAADDQPALPDAEPHYPSARARRRIGIVHDEFTRGVNPFSIMQTMGIADATDDPAHIAELMDEFGIVKVRGVYSPEASKVLQQAIISFSGLTPDDFTDVVRGKKKWGTGGNPTLEDERFWPYAADPTLRRIIEELIGERTIECGSAISAHFTTRGLHRDRRGQVQNPESAYYVGNPSKRIIRVLHYCGSAGGSLGYIPFSHDERLFARKSDEIGLERSLAWFKRHSAVLMKARKERDFVHADQIDRHICWAHADPGDIILNTAGILHCGEFLTGPRYFLVSTYAQSDRDHLDIAMRQSKASSKSREYHEFMLSQGFMGSADVLDELNQVVHA